MEAALITGSVAVLLWVLSRIPGFSAAARLTASVERDLRILEHLPESPARDEWAALVESQVLDLVALRRPAGKPDGPVLLLAAADSRWGWVLRVMAVVALAAATIMTPLLAAGDSRPQADLSAGELAIVTGTLVAAVFGMAAEVVWQRRERRKARAAHDARRRARRHSMGDA